MTAPGPYRRALGAVEQLKHVVRIEMASALERPPLPDPLLQALSRG